MSQNDESLISEAYKQMYVESEQKTPGNVFQTVEEVFKANGWKTKIKHNDLIAEKRGDESEPTYDIYAYMHRDTLQFYATVTMPWEGGIQENEVHIDFNGESEYSVPFSTSADELKNQVKIVIDQVLASRLPEGPSEEDVGNFNQEEKQRSKSNIQREDGHHDW